MALRCLGGMVGRADGRTGLERGERGRRERVAGSRLTAATPWSRRPTTGFPLYYVEGEMVLTEWNGRSIILKNSTIFRQLKRPY